MDATVPGDVHEPDQLACPPGTDPAKTVPVDLRPPIVLEHPMFKAFGMESIDFSVLERPSPFGNAASRVRSCR
ncbi:hypothetical protein GCM10023067_44500 [Aminobacter aganoensis]